MKLLLLSNSGKPLYHWCKKEISQFIGSREVTFISVATVYDPSTYYKAAQESLSEMGIKLNHLILEETPKDLISKTEAFLIGGGNTYNLINQLKKFSLL